ncbi:hypothetical protein [Microbacterium sp. NPDC057650]|uniref:hypothetical protein n=1 Tax=unclassified Microbacterium TaxID=2609290 RepID=UPI00366B3742
MIELDEIDTDEDGALTAIAELPGGRRVTVQYDFDDDFDLDEGDDDELDDQEDDDGGGGGIDPENLPDLDEMQATAEHALARLSEETLDGIEREVVRALAEAAAEDDESDLDDLLVDLADDIALDGVVVFGDGGITLLYVATDNFPDTTVYCLLDDDLEIDDLMVE